MLQKIIVLICLLSSVSVWADEERLSFSQIVTEIPATSKRTLKTSFSKDSLPYWGVILATTGLLYEYDEQIYKEIQRNGRANGIGNQDHTKTVYSIGQYNILRLPTDTGSMMYFMGDGWTHATIGAGFVATGYITKNNKTLNTGIMIWHGMFVSTIFNQALKRSFGRESPVVSTSNRGSWNLFPSVKNYNNHTSKYDAMPSGHVMTATLTWTIITERYPEHKKVLYPIAGVYLATLGYQMVNNGVHWASDYPLGIAMGYVIGKMSTQMGKKMDKKTDPKEAVQDTTWFVMPSFGNGNTMLTATKQF